MSTSRIFADRGSQGIITAWASEGYLQVSGNIEITQRQMQKLSSELFAGYQTYAQNNGLPDPAKLGRFFCGISGIQQMVSREIAAGLSNVMNVDAIQQQMMTAIQRYMQRGSDTDGKQAAKCHGIRHAGG